MIELNIAGWNLNLTPNEERLQNRRSGDNFLVVCKVKDFDGAASDVKIEWYHDGKLIPRFGRWADVRIHHSKPQSTIRSSIRYSPDWKPFAFSSHCGYDTTLNGDEWWFVCSTMTIERTYSNQLMINRPKTSDGGKYTCKAEIHGEEQDVSAEISFVGRLKFHKQLFQVQFQIRRSLWTSKKNNTRKKEQELK